MMVRTKLPAVAAVLAVVGCTTLQTEQPPERNATLRLDRGLEALDAQRYTEAFDDLAWVYTNCPGRETGAHALTALAAIELDPRNPVPRPALAARLLGRLIEHPATPAWVRPMAETSLLTAVALGAPHPDAPPPAATTDSAGSATGDGGGVAGTDTATAEPRGTTLAAGESHATAAADSAPAAGPTPARPPAPAASLPLPGPDERDPVYGCGEAVDTANWTPPALPRLPGPSMADMLLETEASRDALALQVDSLQQELDTVNEQLTATRAELERIRKTLQP
ncbi:MAG: hypothetical protein P8177_05275 [Gemmatimonadota bacterium]|jgi:hypothetical protein